jgi:hypothetical protein
VRSTTVATAAVLALIGTAQPARSDDPAAPATPRPWRVLGGASFASARFATPYASRYSPPLTGFPHQSSATQTLPLDASTGHGLQVSVERTLGAHLAIQLLGEYATSDVTGEPGQYDVRLVYTSRPPPSNDPVVVESIRSEARPPATGELETWVAAANVAAWLDAGSKGRVGVSAGPAWIRTSGRAESLVYTTYSLGGHSVLFSEDHVVSFEFPSSGLGLDVGTFFETDLGSNVGLRLDARYYWSPERDAVVTLLAVVNATDVQSLGLAEIQAGLAPAPVTVDSSFFRAAVSLVIHF